jgi:hypothetical protein
MGIMDYKAAKNATGEKEPKGATSSDRSGERKTKSMRGGVAMGKEDMIGSDKMFNTGRTEGICYEHKKDGYR